MIFALLTLFTALSLAAVAGWFSIVGFMAIYAGAPMAALIMGAVTEAAKLVTISWIYRNWEYAGWRLKGPLIYFTVALMVATSIGVFGFLSKGHLEQGAGTIDNSARIEQLNYQINREKSLIADNEKVIGQLDATVNSFLGKDRTDRSLSVRKSQAPQRKQLRDDSDAAQKRIDALSADKFKFESEVRKMQLDVGPIRYIAELFYGVEENATKNIEAAVRIFTLLIVSTLDPLAVILLVAANHTLLRLRNEKEKTIPTSGPDGTVYPVPASTAGEEISKTSYRDAQTPIEDSTIQAKSGISAPIAETEKDTVYVPVFPEVVGLLNEEKNTPAEEVIKSEELLPKSIQTVAGASKKNTHEEPLDIIREILEEKSDATTVPIEAEAVPEISREEIKAILEKISENRRSAQPPAIVRQPSPTQVIRDKEAIEPSEIKAVDVSLPKVVSVDDSISRELRGNTPHFIPQKVNEEEKPREEKTEVMEKNTSSPALRQEIASRQPQNDKYPKALSWLAEFKRS